MSPSSVTGREKLLSTAPKSHGHPQCRSAKPLPPPSGAWDRDKRRNPPEQRWVSIPGKVNHFIPTDDGHPDGFRDDLQRSMPPGSSEGSNEPRDRAPRQRNRCQTSRPRLPRVTQESSETRPQDGASTPRNHPLSSAAAQSLDNSVRARAARSTTFAHSRISMRARAGTDSSTERSARSRS